MEVVFSAYCYFKIKFMQSWKFNSTAQGILRETISKSLKIPYLDIYKTIRRMNSNFIETKDGRIYEVILQEVF